MAAVVGEHTLACPHCCGIPFKGVRLADITCCVCAGTRRVDLEGAALVMQYVWARPGCPCGACACHEVTEAAAFPDQWPARTRTQAMGCKVLSV